MKANKLTLGDYVQVNGEVYKVISISYFDIGISDSKKDFYHEYIDNIKPIPLTVEILEKNGFIRKYEIGDKVIWKSDDLRIELTDDEWMHNTFNKWSVHIDTEDMSTMFYCELTYVHEFQHAMQLCRIEKEIKL